MSKQNTKDDKIEVLLSAYGLFSPTECRFIKRKSLGKLKGVGDATLRAVKKHLSTYGFSFGKHSLEDYLANREQIWADASGILVFQYKVRSIIIGTGFTTEWALASFVPKQGTFTEKGLPILSFRALSREEARDIIEENGMELAYEDNDGMIYDSPDGKFLAQFGRGSSSLKMHESLDLYVRESAKEEE